MSAAMFETDSRNVRSLYELLNIIDSKASALLSFNALLLAAISIWLGYVPPNFLHLSLDLVFLVLLASCILLLPIIWLHWTQLRGAKKRKAVKPKAVELDNLRKTRTTLYRTSWTLSMIAVGAIGIASAIHTVGTGLKASGHCESGACAWFFGPDIFGNLDHKQRESPVR